MNFRLRDSHLPRTQNRRSNLQCTWLALYTDQLDGVDVVPLEPFPDADLGVGAAEADDVAGGVHEGGDLPVVRQDGVGARAGQQVPQTDHPVLKFIN